jgi:hypothetical protein
MYQLLYKYLVLNQHLSIPGVGSFDLVQLPARLDFINRSIQAPEPIIKFTNQTAIADKKFYAFVSNETNITDVDAIKQLHEFAYKLKNDVLTSHEVTMPGMGVLKKEPGGHLSFEAAPVLHDYFPSAVAERVIHQNAEHTILVGEDEFSNVEMEELLEEQAKIKKDYWWVYALALGIIGVGAIAYYFMNN